MVTDSTPVADLDAGFNDNSVTHYNVFAKDGVGMYGNGGM
jgi:hypothetical protein